MIDKIRTEKKEQIIGHVNGRENCLDWIKYELISDGWCEYHKGYGINYLNQKELLDGYFQKVILSMIKGNLKCLINGQGIHIYHFDKLIVETSFENYLGDLVRSMINDIYAVIYEQTRIWLTQGKAIKSPISL